MGKTDIDLTITGNATSAEKTLTSVETKLDKLGKTGKKTASGFKSELSNMVPSGAMVGMAAATAALGLLSKGIGEVMARQDALADFSAITGVTGGKLAEFGDAAVELSNKFGTGVIDNIEAFKGVLSRLGPDFASSSSAVKSMGDSINTLAMASGLDATQSMDALTTAMLQFGVDLDDPVQAAATAADMMNVMAAGAKEGAAEIPQIAASLKEVGLTADGLNISFSETNAAIQVLAAGGKTGSEAGIGLRNVMLSLSKGTKESNDALGKIGLSTEELGKVMTEQGLEAALRLFNTQLKVMPGLSDQASLKAAVFGKENLAAAGKLIQSADAIGELNGKLQDTTTAYDQAATKMATSSEKIKRAGNEFWNSFVGGVGDAGNQLADTLDGVFVGMEKTADGIRKLMELDFAGFWDTLTMSVGEYNDQKEKQLALEEANYRALIKQSDARIKETDQKQKLLDLQGQLVKALKETDKVTDSGKLVAHMDKFKEMFNAGKIASVDEYFLALKEGAKSTATETEKAGKKTKTLQETLQEEFDKNEKKARENAVMRGKGYGESLNAIYEATRPSLDGIKLKLDEVDDTAAALEFADNMKEQLNQATDASIALQSAFTTVFSSIGSAAMGGTDALKEGLKAILITTLDFVEKEFILAGASAAIRALASGGLSLFVDSAGWVAAFGAIEAAKAAVGSFEVGSPFIPRDQYARLHKGEAVLTADQNAERMKGAGAVSAGSRVGPLKSSQTTIAVRPVMFDYSIDRNRMATARRAG